MMFKSSLLVSAILAAGAPACHHDHPTATPVAAEPTTTGMTATTEPGNTTDQNNSYNHSDSPGGPGTMLPSTEDPNKAIPGGKEPLTNDPDRTGSPGTASGSGAPAGSGSDTGSDMDNSPDTTTPTAAKDTGSGSNTGTGSGSNTTPRNRGTTSGSAGRTRSGSNGSGSSDGSAGSGSDVPH